MPIQITSKRHNFRRCGVAHPSAPVIYATDRFTKAELAVLKKEPMLVVIESPDSDPASDTDGQKGKGSKR